MKSYSLIFFLFIFLLCSTNESYAQEFSVGIYPPIIQATTLPPTVIKPSISITNKTESEITFDIQLKPFRPSGKANGSIIYPNSKSLPEYLIFPKIKFLLDGNAISQITLGPKEKKDINLQIDIDRDTPLSDYYFSVIFISSPEDKALEQNIQIPAGISTNVVLSIGQNKSKNIKVELFSAPKFNTDSAIPITLLVKNSGENLVTPSGNVEIKNMFGKTIEKIPLLPEYVLSNSSRYLTDEHYASRSANAQKLIQKSNDQNVILFEKGGLFGKYEAIINGAILEDQNLVYTSSLVFYVVPIPYIFSVVLAITIIIVIVLKIRKK